MAQRHIQLFRNGVASYNANLQTHADVVKYLLGENSPIKGLDVKDGELVLYRYQLKEGGDIHTIVLAVSSPNADTKTFEVVANYDHLTNLITDLDATVRITSDGTVTVSEDGQLTVSDNTGAYVAIEVVEKDGKLTGIKVKENIDETIVDAIEALNVNPFSLTTLTGTTLQGYQISEVNGEIVKGETPETLLTFVSAPTAENKVVTQAEIIALDSVKENETGDIKVKVSQVDGVLTSVEVTDTLAKVAHSGKAEDVSVAEGIEGLEATNVQGALAELAGDIATLDAAQLSAGNGIDITENKINADFKVTIETLTEGEGDDATKGTYIVITGNGENGQEITKVNANAFVKDGFLQKVELIEGTEEGETENVLRFTWNSDAGIQVTNIPVSDLCDVYTAKANDWIQLNGFEFSHKTVNGLDTENVHGSITRKDTGVTGNNLTNAGESIQLAVPIVEVDAAGHVTRIDEYTTIITLPASIATAVQTVNAAQTEVLSNTKFVAVKTNRAENSNEVVLTTEYRTQAVATATADQDGLATALDVKEYVTANSTTVSTPDNNPVEVSATTNNNNGSTNYQVELSEIEVEEATPTTNSMADDTNTHTYMTGIETDGFGRVTKVLTETMTEDIDAGTYN